MRTSEALSELSEIVILLQVAMSNRTEGQKKSGQLQRDTWVVAMPVWGSPMKRWPTKDWGYSMTTPENKQGESLAQKSIH